MSDEVDQLTALLGIDPEAPAESRRAVAESMGFDMHENEVARALYDLRRRAWQPVVPPAQVLWPGEVTVPLRLPEAETERLARWHIVEGDGREHAGEIALTNLDIGAAETIDGRRYQRLDWPLPVHLPMGYHTLTVEVPGEETAECCLIITPGACYLPENFDRRVWGLACQLYSLTSERNWGMGDYTDLAHLSRQLGGAALIGLNPMHALLLPKPGEYSPYSPSSREFYNPYYIDPETVPEWGTAKDMIQDDSFHRDLAAARAAEIVDYDTVARLKDRAIDALFAVFQKENPPGSATPRRQAFEAYKTRTGDTLTRFATFEALRRHMTATLGSETWQQWPDGYHTSRDGGVQGFAHEQPEAVERHVYAQWLAEMQMESAVQATIGAGRSLGLYFDLAVGVSRDGFDCWDNPALYGAHASIGAPPDMFNEEGQDWGLPPPSRLGLEDDGYDSFIRMVQANMRHASALRIDHVMSLERLFWVPMGRPATEGAYVAYPFRDLAGILALESHRNQCLVIGEDLGTVPEGFRDTMAETNILSYRVLYFERDETGRFRRPDEYPAKSLATISTHDLPPLKGFYRGVDIDWRHNLGIGHQSKEAFREAHDERKADFKTLVKTLREAGALEVDDPDEEEFFRACHRFLAMTESWIVMTQIEDIAGETHQPNLPSSRNNQYPNWCRRLPASLDALLKSRRLGELQQLMAEYDRPSV